MTSYMNRRENSDVGKPNFAQGTSAPTPESVLNTQDVKTVT
jgi:hypothetical protein